LTTEIVQFKCPSCGYLLGEEEYKHACEKSEKQIAEAIKKELRIAEEKIKQLKIEHAKELLQKDEKNKSDTEKEVNKKVTKILSEERNVMELKHNQELAEREKKYSEELVVLKSQNANLIDERIRQAVTEAEVRYKQTEEQFKLQHARIEADNKKLMDQVEKLQKTLDNIPAEIRGTAGEFILVDELKKQFVRDEIKAKRVGVAMADAVQVIVTETGERINIPIVYDRKMGDTVTKSDLEKAKNYKMIHNTDYSIIVTTKGIRNSLFTEEREGILLVHPMVLIDIAKRIRSFIIEASKREKSNISIDSKRDKIYKFVTSAEYNRDVRMKIGIKSSLDEMQRKEEDYHRTTWHKRKESLDKWFELDHKNERTISDIIQEDSDKDRDLTKDVEIS
jgi:hypothetical protein